MDIARFRQLSIAAAVVIAIVVLLPLCSRSQTRVSEQAFRPPGASKDLFILPDGDVISLRKERAPDVPKDHVEIVFSTRDR
jgi:hypothetical protein